MLLGTRRRPVGVRILVGYDGVRRRRTLSVNGPNPPGVVFLWSTGVEVPFRTLPGYRVAPAVLRGNDGN